MMQLILLKVAQPKSGAFRPQVCHGALTAPHGCQTVRWTVSENTYSFILFNWYLIIFWHWHINYYFIHLRVFRAIVNRWFSTGIWVIASLLESQRLFSLFWPILTMLLFGWSPLVLLFPSPSVPVPILWWLYPVRDLLLVSPSLSCSIVFFFSFLAKCWYLSLFSLFLVLLCHQPGRQSPVFGRFSFFLLIIARSGRLAEFRWSFVSPNHWGVCESHSPGWIPVCAHTICSYSQIKTCTIPCGSPSSTSRIFS